MVPVKYNKNYKIFLLSEPLPDNFKKELLKNVWKWRWSTDTEIGYVKKK